MSIYNFRIDKSAVESISESLKQDKVIPQGWGGGAGASACNLDIRQDDFVSKCKEYHELATTRVPSNLLRMRDLKRGDILVIPHLPEYGKVSMHVVADDFPACYEYDADDETHKNHRIKIERSYGLDGKISIRAHKLLAWYGKLSWLRLPILPIPQFEDEFRSIMNEVDQNPNASFVEASIDGYMEELRDETKKLMKNKLGKIRPSGSDVSFEAICEKLLEAEGYEVRKRNQYNSSGGDVDIECVRKRLEWSLFESGESSDVTLFVQIKKHEGETGDYAVEQIVKMMGQRPDARGCVMSLADTFSDNAQKLADGNGILLMNGDTICDLLLMEMVGASKRG